MAIEGNASAKQVVQRSKLSVGKPALLEYSCARVVALLLTKQLVVRTRRTNEVVDADGNRII